MNLAYIYRTPLPDCNSGILKVDDHIFFTVERPWIPHRESKGGTPFQSCIPDGRYTLEPFLRTNGDTVPCMINEDLGVFKYAEDRNTEFERYACLIHIANKVQNVVGCIGPGLGAMNDEKGYRTVSSGLAMNKLQSLLILVTHLEIITNAVTTLSGPSLSEL